MVKSGLKNSIVKFHHEDGYFYYWICDFGHFYEVRKNSLPNGGISKRFFLDQFSAKNCIFRYRFHFEGKNAVWISQVRRVKNKVIAMVTGYLTPVLFLEKLLIKVF